MCLCVEFETLFRLDNQYGGLWLRFCIRYCIFDFLYLYFLTQGLKREPNPDWEEKIQYLAIVSFPSGLNVLMALYVLPFVHYLPLSFPCVFVFFLFSQDVGKMFKKQKKKKNACKSTLAVGLAFKLKTCSWIWEWFSLKPFIIYLFITIFFFFTAKLTLYIKVN